MLHIWKQICILLFFGKFLFPAVHLCLNFFLTTTAHILACQPHQIIYNIVTVNVCLQYTGCATFFSK